MLMKEKYRLCERVYSLDLLLNHLACLTYRKQAEAEYAGLHRASPLLVPGGSGKAVPEALFAREQAQHSFLP